MSSHAADGRDFLCVRHLTVSYNETPVVGDVSMDFDNRAVTALIGPAGTGKTSLLLALNRLIELKSGSSVEGSVFFYGEDAYRNELSPEELRRRLSFISSEPTCFPRSIWENVAWGARVNGYNGDYDELVENCLKRAGLWNEVKGMLRKSALRLSGGQRQRLCIARALAVGPDALLLDEPTSRLDPIATGRIEDVLIQLKEDVGVIFATHDHLQAGRLAEKTALFLPGAGGYGELVEYEDTDDILVNPSDKRTEDYITGKHSKGTRYSV